MMNIETAVPCRLVKPLRMEMDSTIAAEWAVFAPLSLVAQRKFKRE